MVTSKGMFILLLVLGWLRPASAADERHGRGVELWRARISYYSETSPAVATNGVIYFSGADGKLTAYSPAGKELWAFKARMEMSSSPAIADDGTILVGCRDRYFYAVDAAGRQRWRFQTGAWVDTSAAIGGDGTIYFGSWDGNFYALTAEGKSKWVFPTGGPILSSAAIDRHGTIYFGAHDGKLYALSPAGAKLWEFPTRARILSSPAIGNEGEIIFTSLDGNLYVVSSDGKLRWSLRTGGITSSSPVVAEDGTIYLGINQSHVSVSPAGKMNWRGDMSPTGYVPWDWVRSTPMALGTTNFVTMASDLVVILFQANGDWVWNYSMEAGSYSSPAIAADGTIYAAALGGKMFALKNSLPLANSSWPMFRADPQHTGRARR